MLPPKKKQTQTAGTVDYQNTGKPGGAVKANPVSTNQVHGAIKAFVAKKQAMSSKTRKRVANRLKGMKVGAKK